MCDGVLIFIYVKRLLCASLKAQSIKHFTVFSRKKQFYSSLFLFNIFVLSVHQAHSIQRRHLNDIVVICERLCDVISQTKSEDAHTQQEEEEESL